MFGIKNNKLEAWFETLPIDIRKKLEETSPDKWNGVLVEILAGKVKGEEKKEVKSSKSSTEEDKLTSFAKSMGAISVAMIQREFSVEEKKAEELLNNLEQKGIAEHGELHAIRKVYNSDADIDIDDVTVSGIVNHLLEHQTISEEVLKNKFALSDSVAPIMLDALQESGFISS